jgi:hypothetical protein
MAGTYVSYSLSRFSPVGISKPIIIRKSPPLSSPIWASQHPRIAAEWVLECSNEWRVRQLVPATSGRVFQSRASVGGLITINRQNARVIARKPSSEGARLTKQPLSSPPRILTSLNHLIQIRPFGIHAVDQSQLSIPRPGL